jgi:hypothetical protein
MLFILIIWAPNQGVTGIVLVVVILVELGSLGRLVLGLFLLVVLPLVVVRLLFALCIRTKTAPLARSRWNVSVMHKEALGIINTVEATNTLARGKTEMSPAFEGFVLVTA